MMSHHPNRVQNVWPYPSCILVACCARHHLWQMPHWKICPWVSMWRGYEATPKVALRAALRRHVVRSHVLGWGGHNGSSGIACLGRTRTLQTVIGRKCPPVGVSVLMKATPWRIGPAGLEGYKSKDECEKACLWHAEWLLHFIHVR